MVWIPEGEKSLMIYLAISIEYQQCDRWTDGQTSCDNIVGAMHSIVR